MSVVGRGHRARRNRGSAVAARAVSRKLSAARASDRAGVEWSGRGLRPFDETNEAYKLGVNYLVYSLTHY